MWNGRHDSEPLSALWTRQYKPNGQRRGDAFGLTSTVAVPAYPHAIGLAADGSFVVAWTGQEGDGPNDPDVFARRLAPDGSPLSQETPIAQWTNGQQRGAALALAPDGRGIVVWESEGRDGDSYGISARRLRAGLP